MLLFAKGRGSGAPLQARGVGLGAGGGLELGLDADSPWLPPRDLGISTCCRCPLPAPARAHAKPPCLFCLKAKYPPEGRDGGRDARSGLIALNQPDEAGCQRGLCQGWNLPVRTARVWWRPRPGSRIRELPGPRGRSSHGLGGHGDPEEPRGHDGSRG